MRKALDEKGNFVFADKAVRGQYYFCDGCNEELILKLGNGGRIPHFAHPKGSSCSFTKEHDDMSEWHVGWQEKFPREQQEISKEYGGEKHRADVLIESKKTVYEFQHSSLGLDEFETRNAFYGKLGYKVIWVFDEIEKYKDGYIKKVGYPNEWEMSYPRKTLWYFDPEKNSGVEVFFQLQEDGGCLVRMIKHKHRLGSPFIFTTDGKKYSDSDVVHFFEENDASKECCKVSDLFDKLLFLGSDSHTDYYFGCPISKTHKCASSAIDLSESQFGEITACSGCSFSGQTGDMEMTCRKRFSALHMSKGLRVKIISRDENDFISKISYLDEKQNEHEIPIPCVESPEIDSIIELWKKNECCKAIFLNIKTQKYFKISKDPIKTILKYGKVYGYCSNDGESWSKQSYEVYFFNLPQWYLVWDKKLSQQT